MKLIDSKNKQIETQKEAIKKLDLLCRNQKNLLVFLLLITYLLFLKVPKKKKKKKTKGKF